MQVGVRSYPEFQDYCPRSGQVHVLCLLISPTPLVSLVPVQEIVKERLAEAKPLDRDNARLPPPPISPNSSVALPPVVVFKEKFSHVGPNGRHMCLVFEVLGRPGVLHRTTVTELTHSLCNRNVGSALQKGAVVGGFPASRRKLSKTKRAGIRGFSPTHPCPSVHSSSV